MTDEVLTERRAGWHAGRSRPWRLRGRPEIALLLHYSITSQLTSPSWLSLHHATTKMSWDENNWMQWLWVTQTSHQGKGKRSCNTVFPGRQTSSHGMMICTSNKRYTSCVIKINAPQPIHVLLFLLFSLITKQNISAAYNPFYIAWQTRLSFSFSTNTTLFDTSCSWHLSQNRNHIKRQKGTR